MTKTTAQKVAAALIKIGAVGFAPDKPITFKSGMLAPMYVDNRKFPSFPKEWRVVLNGFIDTIKAKKITFDLIAGIETAGIPHSAALGVLLKKPSVFARKAVKDHGTKKMIEGGEVAGKKVLLIEDLVTTGQSSLHGVTELRAAGAQVKDCLVIVSYGFPDSRLAFNQAQVKLHALTDVKTILAVAEKRGLLTAKNKEIITEWSHDPWLWTEKMKRRSA